MFIVAQHSISNPQQFWNLAQTTPVPAHLKLHSVFPSTDFIRGVCLWEAESVEKVKQFVEPLTSACSKNEYLTVAAASAVGLPK